MTIGCPFIYGAYENIKMKIVLIALTDLLCYHGNIDILLLKMTIAAAVRVSEKYKKLLRSVLCLACRTCSVKWRRSQVLAVQ